LAHAVLFLATSPKSNSTTKAIAAVKKALKTEAVQAVPEWLRDAHNKTNRALGNGDGYLYSHDFPEAISGQEYMVDPQSFYTPGNSGAEAATANRLEHLRVLKARIQSKNKI
jgi:putative ATPase